MRRESRDLFGSFVRHKVAANLLMLAMFLGGTFALDRMTVQFFPDFNLGLVDVSVIWTGASAEDIENGITNPLEQRLRSIDGLHKLTSTSTQGACSITLEFEDGTDPLLALDQVRRAVDEQRGLPAEAENPKVASVTRYEPVARLLISAPGELAELRRLARRFEKELLDAGIDRVDVLGLPEEQISIGVDPVQLQRLGMSLDQMADRVAAMSRDQPAGIVGRAEGARELRSLDQRRDPLGFARLPLLTGSGVHIALGDVATIERRPKDGAVLLEVDGEPAAELTVMRAAAGDALRAADTLERWLAATRPGLPPGVKLRVYDESWRLIRDRIDLLLTNGASGLAIVVLVLYLFLDGRVAFWVAMGIPASVLAALFALWLAGGSINMLSLFSLIMALGIIVDDAIVVGEEALSRLRTGASAALAAEAGARRMLAPVVASSLSTIAAFLPLMLVGGVMGNLLFEIPLVTVCVLAASLAESFLVLPGHLHHSFERVPRTGPRALRQRLDGAFDWLRDRVFRPFLRAALAWRRLTISVALATLILVAGLAVGGRLAFDFFPTPESQILHVNANFVAGTPRKRVEAFLDHLLKTLYRTEREFGQGRLVQVALVQLGARVGDGAREAAGDQFGGIEIELTPSDHRSVRNDVLIRAWRRQIRLPAGLDTFTITSRRAGPPGRDLTIRLTGRPADVLKAAALELEQTLATLPGVSSVEDDLIYGREQRVYAVAPAGQAEGLDVAELGRQLRSAFDGRLVQIFQDGSEEMEVRVELPEQYRSSAAALQRLHVQLPGGGFVPLDAVTEWNSRQGFEPLRHAEGRLAVEVSADLDPETTTLGDLSDALNNGALPQLAAKYGVGWTFEGRSADQRETLADMAKGALLGLLLIYLVLAWVFSSYGWPVVVMLAIPFGLIGGVLGHYIMGITFTVMSLFGLFGLSGIVVNDAIVLVRCYQGLRAAGTPVGIAVEEAASQRLRAVLLTSLTTIGGLVPLLAETSLQAQFLVPMATSIAFGLGFATLVVLVLVPTLLSVHESASTRVGGIRRDAPPTV